MATTTLTVKTATAGFPTGRRRAPWRSPEDQPRYARPALLAIAALGAVLWFWDIGGSQYHPFFAETARSMTGSWKAFVYGSFDPGNSITIDKLPGFLWPQALSARLLGFHPWALTLPQVLEGIASVLVLYRAVRRWAGANAGLLAALAYTLTPVIAGLFRTAVEDPAFTLLVLLAADATLQAARQGRLRPLVMAGVWVGLAFQAKMLEAWAVLPALGLAYLVAAPAALRRRLVHTAVAGAVAVAVSASWILLVTLTPAKDRPYVDGTTDNSAYSMVVGYNFLNRFSSVGLSAADTGSITAVRGPATAPQRATGRRGHPAAPAGQGADGHEGWLKMFGPALAPQTGWFYPVAALSALLGVAWRRGRPRTDLLRAGYLMWGVWFVLYFLVFSAGSIGGHTYYFGVVAVPLAALTGAGTAMMWRAHRAGGPRAWALPAAVAATGAWGAFTNLLFPAFLPWLTPVAGLLAVAALILLARTRGGAGTRRLATAGLAAGLAAMLLPPAAWASAVLQPRYAHSGMGTVGPSSTHDRAASRTHHRVAWRKPASAAWRPSDGATLTMAQRRLLDYAQVHRDGARYLFATPNWNAASPYILAEDAPVLPMGGFTGMVPSPSLGGFRQLVADGEVHYVLLGGTTRRTASLRGDTPPARIAAWVRSTCVLVPPADYGGTTGPGAQQLYHCVPR